MSRRRSRIVAREEPVKVPKPVKAPVSPPKRVLGEFRKTGEPVRLQRLPRPCGPAVQGHTCVASWKVLVSDEALEAWMEVGEAYGNVQRLCHGTRARNVAAITTEGLRTGSTYCMFGKGIYFGQISKAIGYTGGSLWRGPSTGAGYVFEADVILGKSKVCSGAQKVTLKELEAEGFQSVHGRHGYTSSYGGTLRNDEWVVYSPDQVLLVNLHEYQPNGIPDDFATPTYGYCGLIRTKNVPLGPGNRAFKDIISQQPCGNRAYTRVTVQIRKGKKIRTQDVWACKSCVDAGKLRIGSTVRCTGPSYYGATNVVDGKIVKAQ